MNKLLLKGAGVLGVVTVLALGVAITKNYMIDPATSLATPLPATGSSIQYKIGCMDIRACNYDKTAKVKGDCDYAMYAGSNHSISEQFRINRKPNMNIPPLTQVCKDVSCEVEIFIKQWTTNTKGEITRNTVRSGGFTTRTRLTLYDLKNACGDPSLKNNTAK